MKKFKRIFTAVLSLCLIIGLVATNTITSEAKGKKKSAKKAKAVATSTVNDPTLFALMVKGDTFTYNGKEYSSSKIGSMNLEQAANLLGLTVSKGGDGSIEDPHGAWTEENRAQADITLADSADGRIHIQRFIDLRGSMPTRTLFSYDGNTFELNMPYYCSGLSYDSASTESLYASYGDSWNVKALDSYLRAGGYTSMNDVLSRNGLKVRTYNDEASWSAYIAADGWGFKDTMTINGVKYPYHAYVRPHDFANPNGEMDTELMILKPDGSIIGYATSSDYPTQIACVNVF
jgi:hypothetical protein